MKEIISTVGQLFTILFSLIGLVLLFLFIFTIFGQRFFGDR